MKKRQGCINFSSIKALINSVWSYGFLSQSSFHFLRCRVIAVDIGLVNNLILRPLRASIIKILTPSSEDKKDKNIIYADYADFQLFQANLKSRQFSFHSFFCCSEKFYMYSHVFTWNEALNSSNLDTHVDNSGHKLQHIQCKQLRQAEVESIGHLHHLMETGNNRIKHPLIWFLSSTLWSRVCQQSPDGQVYLNFPIFQNACMGWAISTAKPGESLKDHRF